MHDLDDFDHLHEGGGLFGGPEDGTSFQYQLDNVTLTTIGVDVGSSTFHMMFAQVHLRRETQRLSSKFKVISREILWQSPIELTPYAGRLIDTDEVRRFVAAGHVTAGITPDEVDSGAVILTGEALRRENARALADAVAEGSGKFVCVSAGHHLESMLAAFGSGAAAAAKAQNKRILHVDVGGGTTKLAIIEPHGVVQTAAVIVGGRVIAWDEAGKIVRISAGARPAAHEAGVALALGVELDESEKKKIADTLAGVILDIIGGEHSNTLEPRLRLTPVLPRHWRPEAVTFSGGVSEYIYGREAGDYGDLGPMLGASLREGLERRNFGFEVINPGEGIRATVIGAAQSTAQLSGNTVTVTHPEQLPVHNVPVIHPHFDPQTITAESVAAAIRQARANHGFSQEDAVALAFTWQGEPSYPRLRALASGIEDGLKGGGDAPALVLIDDDIGASLGRLLLEEVDLGRPLICLDGLTLSPLDYVDVGRVLQPQGVLPVVIKSLLFNAIHEGALD